MIRLLADENLNRQIVNGLRRRNARIDIVTAQDAGLTGFSDPEVLAWAAANDRVLITHDHQTMPDYYYGRMAAGLPCSGLILVQTGSRLAELLFDIDLICRTCSEKEMAGAFMRLPL
jgi:hypothetical protein